MARAGTGTERRAQQRRGHGKYVPTNSMSGRIPHAGSRGRRAAALDTGPAKAGTGRTSRDPRPRSRSVRPGPVSTLQSTRRPSYQQVHRQRHQTGNESCHQSWDENAYTRCVSGGAADHAPGSLHPPRNGLTGHREAPTGATILHFFWISLSRRTAGGRLRPAAVPRRRPAGGSCGRCPSGSACHSWRYRRRGAGSGRTPGPRPG